MNEASSKYVDQIAIEKLLSGKLRLVRHSPNGAALRGEAPFADFLQLAPQPVSVETTLVRTRGGVVTELDFASPIQTPYEENNRVRCRFLAAANPMASLILVHGLFEDNFELYNYFLAMLGEQGYDVYRFVLPYHFHRKPVDSFFSGEYFWSADLSRSTWAYKQAVYDLRQLHGYVSSVRSLPVRVAGFSMGAGIVLSLAGAMPLDGVFAINPICNMSELVWNSKLFSTMRRDLESAGLGLPELQQIYAPYEPLNATSPATRPDRIAVARSLWDQINDVANYDRLVGTWHIERVFDYKAGHLNILRVPRLATDLRDAMEGRSA